MPDCENQFWVSQRHIIDEKDATSCTSFYMDKNGQERVCRDCFICEDGTIVEDCSNIQSVASIDGRPRDLLSRCGNEDDGTTNGSTLNLCVEGDRGACQYKAAELLFHVRFESCHCSQVDETGYSVSCRDKQVCQETCGGEACQVESYVFNYVRIDESIKKAREEYKLSSTTFATLLDASEENSHLYWKSKWIDVDETPDQSSCRYFLENRFGQVSECASCSVCDKDAFSHVRTVQLDCSNIQYEAQDTECGRRGISENGTFHVCFTPSPWAFGVKPLLPQQIVQHSAAAAPGDSFWLAMCMVWIVARVLGY